MLEEKIRKWLSNSNFDIGTVAVSDTESFFAMATDVGLRRKENQDRVAAISVNGGGARQHSFFCVTVCDGMGGMKDGATSATIGASSFFATLVHERRVPASNRLRLATEMANRNVYEQVRGGGTTLSAVLIEDGIAYLVNVGDSRIYAAIGRGDTARLERATTDDSMKEAFGAEGEGLLQFIGMGEGLNPHVRMPTLNFESLLITTDGAHAVGDDVLAQVYLNAETISEAAHRLTALARWTGGQDNATVAVISAAALSGPSTIPKDAEIAIWSPFGQLQIAWISSPREIQPHPEPPSPPSKEVASSGSAKKSPKGGRKSKKRKTKHDKEENIQFDIGFAGTVGANDDADS